MSSVIEDLKRLEDRILARIQELEANVAELEQLRDVAARLGILTGDGRDSARATPRATATARGRRRTRGRATSTNARSGGARSATAATRSTTAGANGRAGGADGRAGGAEGRAGGTNGGAGGANGRAGGEHGRGAADGRSTRRERVLEVVAVEPGISVREIVAQLGVNRTSLYPVVRQLVSDGLLHKDGRGLWLAAR